MVKTNKQKEGEGSSITVYTPSHPAGPQPTHTQFLSGFR